MKKYTEKFTKMTHADLKKKAEELRKDIIEMKRGVKLGDAQNTQMAKKNRKDLARVLTMLSRPESNEPKEKVAKTTKKENK